jgi:hypothetical protein
MQDDKKISARFIASYQLLGDPQGDQWMAEVLDDARIRDKIEGFQILACETGIWGIQFVLFQIDVLIPHHFDHAEAKDYMSPELCQIVGDSDIEILWVSSTPTPQ